MISRTGRTSRSYRNIGFFRLKQFFPRGKCRRRLFFCDIFLSEVASLLGSHGEMVKLKQQTGTAAAEKNTARLISFYQRQRCE